ncbi:MAG TPA: hypothetical protein VF257_02965 [Solirubrobacteraceae bacterium]
MLAALAALLVLLPAAARAEEPEFTAGPVIQGRAIVGTKLKVLATWKETTPATTATYTWARCPQGSIVCTVIADATEASYVLTAADVGYQLTAAVTLTSGEDPPVTKSTAPTAVVIPKPPPAPKPAPKPVSPPPAPAPAPPPALAPATIVAASTVAPTPLFLRPFPVIRIRGFFARHGARITLLSVRGPRLAKVAVRCSGRGCPTRALTLPTADLRVHRFERFLRAGILLQIRVTRPGRIGTYTSFLIRSKRAPLRTDRCLSARSSRPIHCSAP